MGGESARRLTLGDFSFRLLAYQPHGVTPDPLPTRGRGAGKLSGCRRLSRLPGAAGGNSRQHLVPLADQFALSSEMH